MAKLYKAQVNKLPYSKELSAILEYLCSESNKLYNCTTYLARQIYFKTGKYANKFWLASQMKSNPHMKALYTSAAQQTCISVGEAFKSYRQLLGRYLKGELPNKPKLPNYRKRGLLQISYPKRWLKLTPNGIRVPLGKSCQAWFGLSEVFVPFPSNLDWDDVQELSIVPRAIDFDAVWVTKSQAKVSQKLDRDRVLAIDHGLDNWLTCISNVNTSFIIDGKHLKSVNQWYNKRMATIKENKAQDFWCRLLGKITSKRNRQMRDAINKAAKLVVDHCLDNNIGTIVFGWNKGQKQCSNMGKKNNQKFVQVPTAKLKKRVEQLCLFNGIRFIETEESYSSKASALDLDLIPVFGEKPEGWKQSGTRVNRGWYRSASGAEFNADINGAINIARKVAKQYEFQFDPRGFARGVLTMPRRLRFWSKPSSLDSAVKESLTL
ncbi:MAG: RNA-guided endonuclease InsQ/TnpB family protein [Xenococcus sp. (in: cyanobacteria)]